MRKCSEKLQSCKIQLGKMWRKYMVCGKIIWRRYYGLSLYTSIVNISVFMFCDLGLFYNEQEIF